MRQHSGVVVLGEHEEVVIECKEEDGVETGLNLVDSVVEWCEVKDKLCVHQNGEVEHEDGKDWPVN